MPYAQHLESLGLSSTYEELQLSSFSGLTNLQKLVLDYSLDSGLVDAGGVLEQLQVWWRVVHGYLCA